MSCTLDAGNMCCWTHGCDITEADYVEGFCALGEEEEFEDDEEIGDDPPAYRKE